MDLASIWRVLVVLMLVTVANGAPILLARMLRNMESLPVDFNLHLNDGRPLFGISKTWPGLIASIVGAAIASLSLGYPWQMGAAAGAAAMAGDLCSSFFKRRLGIVPSGRAPIIDKLPEAMFPALILMQWMPLTFLEVLAAVLLFMLLELPLSIALFHMGIREKPY